MSDDPLTWLCTEPDVHPPAEPPPTDDLSLAEKLGILNKTVERHGVGLSTLRTAVADLEETHGIHSTEIKRALATIRKQLTVLEQGEKLTQKDLDLIKGTVTHLGDLSELNHSYIERLTADHHQQARDLSRLKQFRLTLTHLVLLILAGAFAISTIHNHYRSLPLRDFYLENRDYIRR
ncbi:hypothetical protein QGP82_25210 [Leptothoe sp. LEGE 181152]|nr:hypothetical protein [Leptothoe sp. LEGE 181152]